jgi:hypothetical protein
LERRSDELSPGDVNDSRDARVQQVDLRARLERLPDGHPSSPYRDDGSRKPPSADLAELEIPLPDELPSEKKRTNPDGSWDWKGRHLTPEQSRITDQAIARCRDAEGRDAEGKYGDRGLTPAMRRIEAQLDHGALVEDTEKYALKEPNRFKEKLARLISDEPDSDPAEIVSRINDGVRYTYTYSEEQYSLGVMEVCASLADAGFEMYERKNVWVDESKAYQGVNSSWMDHESKQLFEVQIHTPTSWRAKQEGHLTYEIIKASSNTPEERAAAAKFQERIFGSVPIPPGVSDIPSYRKEGW